MTGYMEVAISSASPEWPTPRWLVDQLADEFGPFDTDPAATASNAKAPLFYTQDDDGLAQHWKGRVWLNPPYGRTIGAWMAKARDEVAAGNADRVVCLVPARVDTRWWRASTGAASLVRIWPGRIAFADGTQPAPFPSAVIVLGKLPGQTQMTEQQSAHRADRAGTADGHAGDHAGHDEARGGQRGTTGGQAGDPGGSGERECARCSGQPGQPGATSGQPGTSGAEVASTRRRAMIEWPGGA